MQSHVQKSQNRFCRSESLRAQNGNSPSFSGKEGEGREWGRAEWREIKMKSCQNQTMKGGILCYTKELGLFPADDGMTLE